MVDRIFGNLPSLGIRTSRLHVVDHVRSPTFSDVRNPTHGEHRLDDLLFHTTNPPRHGAYLATFPPPPLIAVGF